MSFKPFLFGLAAAVSFAGQAQAANLLTNGDFETNVGFSAEIGASYLYPNGVAGWSSPSTTAFNVLFNSANATTVDAQTRFTGSEPQRLAPSFAPSANGGFIMALDGDTSFNGPFSQTVSGLTVGKTYRVGFEWAATQYSNRTGATEDQLFVTFGGITQATTKIVGLPSQGFAGWFNETFDFTAINTTETLSFLSVGAPNGLPPVVLLDGVSLTAVPEPQTWAMLLAGFGMVGLATRRRRSAVAA